MAGTECIECLILGESTINKWRTRNECWEVLFAGRIAQNQSDVREGMQRTVEFF
jgi:hypothetical protein